MNGAFFPLLLLLFSKCLSGVIRVPRPFLRNTILLHAHRKTLPIGATTRKVFKNLADYFLPPDRIKLGDSLKARFGGLFSARKRTIDNH